MFYSGGLSEAFDKPPCPSGSTLVFGYWFKLIRTYQNVAILAVQLYAQALTAYEKLQKGLFKFHLWICILYKCSNFIIIFNFTVQVLAEEAVPVENLDLQAARDILSKAQSDVTSAGADMLKLAEGQIAVEVGEALVKAAEGQL